MLGDHVAGTDAQVGQQVGRAVDVGHQFPVIHRYGLLVEISRENEAHRRCIRIDGRPLGDEFIRAVRADALVDGNRFDGFDVLNAANLKRSHASLLLNGALRLTRIGEYVFELNSKIEARSGV
jgi:hypothetical protein